MSSLLLYASLGLSGSRPENLSTGRSGPLNQASFVSSFLPVDDLTKPSVLNFSTRIFPTNTWKRQPQTAQYAQLHEIPNEPSGQYRFAPMQLLSREGTLPGGIFSMSHDGMFITVTSVLNHPFSRGSTYINSDAKAKPTIDTGYFSHPLDLELHARHLIFLEKLMATEPMVSLLKPSGRRTHNHDKAEPITDLETAHKIAKELVIFNYHNCGSCTIMLAEKGGVVSDRLLVHGTRNLRIVDASIFPLVPREISRRVCLQLRRRRQI